MRKFIPWGQVDWRKSNEQLALELGCTTTAVWGNRKALGHPPVKILQPPRKGTTTHKISLMATDGMTINEVAKEAGCTYTCAKILLRRLKKPFKRDRRRRPPKYDYAKADWSQSNTLIAKALGIKNLGIVGTYRRRNNIAPPPPQPKRIPRARPVIDAYRTKKLLALLQWLRKSRKEAGLSLPALSRKSGLTFHMVQHNERGIRKMDPIEYGITCEAIGVHPKGGLAFLEGRRRK